MLEPFHHRLDCNLKEIELLAERIDDFAEAQGLSPDLCGEVQLVLEEIVSNIIKHGYRYVAGKPIDVTISRDADQLVIVIADSAPPFNPLQVADPDLAKPMPDKQPGGLGIHLVKQLMTSVNYEHVEGKNRLTLRKRLDGVP